ncbi:MAG: hypothetical protein H7Z17_09675 [Fuerstia sp.]|nr:hypothetical protein [Fuerstiella sp.]
MRNVTSQHVVPFMCIFLALEYSVIAQDAARFPSFALEHSPPPDYQGMVFDLSQDYPTEAPPVAEMPWDTLNFRTQPLEYARAVLKYGVEGNTEVDWVVQKNAVRKWYHAPWMHPGCGGREFVRGMTRERSSRPGELHPNQTKFCDNWAVGFYNPPGGYTVGQVWSNANEPNPSSATFPYGTVGMKLLFTTATVEEAPFLEGSLEWTANIYPRTDKNPCGPDGPKRENLTLRLLQIDIAVRDKRKDHTTGWVFGTFIYDGSATGETPFDRMQPVGLMWDDDETVTTDMKRPGVFVNPDLKGGSLNADLIGDWDPANPKKVRLVHAGLGGRLNGPVDNPISSCMSCHGRAGAPSQPEVPQGISKPEQYTEAAFKQFFADIPPGAAKDTGADGKEYTRLDYSLQLDVGIRNFTRAQPHVEAPEVAAITGGPQPNRGNDESGRWEVPQPTANSDAPKKADDVAPTVVPAADAEKPKDNSFRLYMLIGVVVLIAVLFFAMRGKQA